MSRVPYTKQIQTFANQINILKQRGLLIANEHDAEKWLHKVSYYRMSGYWYPLLADRQNHIFKPGSTFEQAKMLYEFDSQLRRIVLSAIERIEIAVRTQMAYVMSHAHGGYWFSDANLFTSQSQHAKTLASIQDEFQRSDEQFVRSFKRKYSDPLPPSWITLEITSFGTMSILYQNLKPGHSKRDVAAAFGVSDLSLTYSSKVTKVSPLKEVVLGVQFNNLFDAHYATSGWAYSCILSGTHPNENRYYQLGFVPMAGRTAMANLTLRF